VRTAFMGLTSSRDVTASGHVINPNAASPDHFPVDQRGWPSRHSSSRDPWTQTTTAVTPLAESTDELDCRSPLQCRLTDGHEAGAVEHRL
jgi:hypothetical protein